MVNRARERLSSNREAHVEVADVTALPFDTGRFDVVTSYLMLHHVIDWANALTEIGRVLKPGGAFIGYDLTDTRLARWIHTIDQSPHRILAPDELSEGLTAAGFSAVQMRPSAREHLVRFHAIKPSGM
jgi:SAM-dependent methyltransferase